MSNLKKAVFGATTFVLLCGTMAFAQQPGDRRAFQPPPPGQPSARLTNADVEKLLNEMGYAFKLFKVETGGIVFQLDIPSASKTVPLDISLSPDTSKLWLTVGIRQLAPNETIPSHIMMKMLESNSRLGPCHFAVNQARILLLNCPLDNRNMTRDDLRRQIDIYVNVYNTTENLWNSAKWGV